MPRTINTHAYATQAITDSSASYGAVLSGVPMVAKFASLATKQGGVSGHRTTRTITKTVTVAGVNYPVSASYTVFQPSSLPTSEAASAVAELKALIAETSFDAGVDNRSLE